MGTAGRNSIHFANCHDLAPISRRALAVPRVASQLKTKQPSWLHSGYCAREGHRNAGEVEVASDR